MAAEALVEVLIPPGCHAGSELVVNAGGDQEVLVTIPEGFGPGELLLVDLSPVGGGHAAASGFEEELVVNVVVPDGAEGGSEIIVDVGDGRELAVVVPQGLQPGDTMEVVVPAAAALSPSPPPHAEPLPPELPPEPPPPPDEVREPQRVQAAELSDSDEDDPEQGAKFGVGQPVEVLRNDGEWSLATVVDYEDGGMTYTISLVDGRHKYFVEETDLRIPRFLLLSTANL